MALLGAALRVGGGALARNIMGRKKKVKPSAIAPEKVMGQKEPEKGNGLVKRPTSKTALAKPMKPLQMASTSAVSKDDPLKVIHVKVLEIESILKGTLAAEKEEQKRKKQELQDQRRAQQEEGLEKNPKKKPEKKPKMPKKMPKVGLFGFIKNFIAGVIMNYFVGFLIDNAKTVANILKVVSSVTDFLAEAGIQIFNALATFVDWGYKAIDATRGFIKTLGGEGLAQNFDKVTNLVGTALFLATTIAGSMAVEALTGGGDVPGKTPKPKRTVPGARPGRGGLRGGKLSTISKVKKFLGPVGRFLGPAFFAIDFFTRKGSGQSNVQAGAGAAASVGGFSAGAAVATKVLSPLIVTPIPGARILYGLGILGGGILGSLGLTALTDKATGADRPNQYKKSSVSPDTTEPSVTSLGSGGGSLKDMSDQDFSDLAFIVSHEAKRNTDDEYGVAAAVLNRVADSRFPNTIMGVGTAPGQFEAVFSGKAYRDPKLAEKLKSNQGKIIDALKKLDGRTDFKAFSSMGEFMGDTDVMFADGGNFYHYAEQKAKTDPIPSNIPQDWKKLLGESTGEQFTSSTPVAIPPLPDKPGDKDTPSGGDISVSGSNIVNIGKDLISQGFSVAEHPDFTKTPTASGGTYTPGKGSVSRVHKGAGHYDGRAIDVTDWRGSLEDSKARYRSVLTSLQDNPAIKMLIHDSWGGMYSPGQKQGPGGHGHPTHMHIEVKDKGGFIGKGLFANLGGTEFVTDADSTAALKQVAPGLMMALNQARDAKGVQSALQQYASYEQGAAQTIMIDDSSEDMSPMSEEQSPMPSFAMSSGSDSYDNSFDFLDYQG